MLDFGRRILVTIVGLCCFAGAAAAQQAYEPFNYPAGGPINGKNGGTGWAAPWTGFANNVVAPGLSYPGLAVSGNALGPTPGNASSRALAAPVVGASGGSVVLTALIRSNVPGTPATQATLGNSSGGTFILGDLPQQDAAAGRWGLQTSAGRFYSNKPVLANATTYLVGQIDFNVNGTNDRVRLWVNPPANAWYTVAPDVDQSNANIGQFSGVFWQTQLGQQAVDEIRVYSTAKSCVLPPSNVMVGWYPYDETSGTLAANLATGNFGAHTNGPTPVPGIVAGALRFDGVDDFVQSPSTIATNFGPPGPGPACSGSFASCTGDFTIDAWIRLDPNATQGIMIIVDKRAGNPPGIKGYSFFLLSGRLWLQLADGGASGGFSNYMGSVLSPALNDNNWHHVAVTVKRTSATGIVFYHNGLPAGTANPLGRQGSLVNNSPLAVGTRTAAPPLSGWFDGDIDELEIFSRALTAQEIKNIYTAGPFGKCK